MRRFFDILTSISAIIILLPILILIFLSVKYYSKDSTIFWSERAGINNQPFKMPKFRTMREDAPIISSDKLKNPHSYLIPIGMFLRMYSLDELPQLYSILKGDMSLIGPRPALLSQSNLLNMRKKENIISLKPGITGWAQVNGRDHLTDKEKVKLEKEYLNKKSIFLDAKILMMTFTKVFNKDGVSH